MTTSMSYCYFRNLLPELSAMDDMLESLLDNDSETVSLDELSAAKRCFELLGNDEAVQRIASKIDEVREAQP